MLRAILFGFFLIASAGIPALAEILHFHAKLTAGDEVPPNSSQATGTMRATLDTSTRMLKWSVSYENLSGPARAAHFHGPASSKETAPPIIPVSGNLATPVEGSAEIS